MNTVNKADKAIREQKEKAEPGPVEAVAETAAAPVESRIDLGGQTTITYFNTFNDHSTNHQSQCYRPVIDPLERIMQLYEALLRSERERVELLERLLMDR